MKATGPRVGPFKGTPHKGAPRQFADAHAQDVFRARIIHDEEFVRKSVLEVQEETKFR